MKLNRSVSLWAAQNLSPTHTSVCVSACPSNMSGSSFHTLNASLYKYERQRKRADLGQHEGEKQLHESGDRDVKTPGICSTGPCGELRGQQCRLITAARRKTAERHRLLQDKCSGPWCAAPHFPQQFCHTSVKTSPSLGLRRSPIAIKITHAGHRHGLHSQCRS